MEGVAFGSLFEVDLARNARKLCFMRNLTLRIEENTLVTARRIAAEQSTSVNALVREFLGDLARNQDRRSAARRELVALSRESGARIGNREWNRDDLHER